MRPNRVFAVALLIVAPALLRAVHFQRSLAPMGALALFCGARFRNRWLAFAVPLGSAALGDVLIGVFHHNVSFYTFHPLMLASWACYAISVAMGLGLRRYWDRVESEARRSGESAAVGGSLLRAALPVLTTRVLPIAVTTLAGAAVFFIGTNLLDWFFYYPRTWAGLVDCYVKAIPFFERGTLLADVAGAALFFGGDYLLQLKAAPQPDSPRW